MTFPLLLHAIRASDDGDAGPVRLRGSSTEGLDAPAVLDAETARIVACVREGDETAFIALYRGYYPRLCGFVLPYVREKAAAEDLVSDLFLWIWRNRSTWRVTGRLQAYLFSAARHRAFNRVRDLRRRLGHEEMAAADGETPGMGTGAVAMAMSDDARSVWSAIDMLPERRRLVMTLRWKEAMPLAEIAVVLGTSEMAVRQLHKRALTALREQLADLLE